MKNFKIVFAILLLLSIISACGSKYEITPIEIGINATIDGERYRTPFATAKIYVDTVFNMQYFSIHSSQEYTEEITERFSILFILPEEDKVEEKDYLHEGLCMGETELCGGFSYGLKTENENLTHSTFHTNGKAFFNISGIIYKPNGIIEGTFSGVMLDDTNNILPVTDGSFKLPIE